MDVNAEEILEQSERMHRLAYAVVRDAAAADDVVQQAWLQALRRAPADRRARGAWLASVVRNLALNWKRSAARRGERERVAARAEAQTATDDVVARIEARRDLLAALASLEEPYRRTVTYRYLDGLGGEEIARHEGVPAGTVRWRLARGLELLRAELDRRHDGDRRAWCLALLPPVRAGASPPVISTGAVAAQGAWLVNVLVKAVIVAGVGAAVGVGILSLREPRRAAETAARARSAAQAALVEPAAPRGAELEALTAAAEEARTEVPPAAQAHAASTPHAGAARAVVTARIVDAARRPIAGALVVLDGGPTARSAADGSVELAIAALDPGTAIAAVSGAGFASRWIELEVLPDAPTPLGDVVLQRGSIVSGRVLAPDGTPQAGATVTATGLDALGAPDLHLAINGPRTYPGAPSTRTNAEGEFRLEGVEPGGRRVSAQAPGTRHAWSPPLALEPGVEREDVVLELATRPASDWIEGRVLAPDGSTVPTARLMVRYQSLGWSSSRGQRIDADGGFRFTIEMPGPHDLRASDPEGRWPDAIALAVEPGARDVLLAFREPVALEVSVHSSAGEPLEDFALHFQRSPSRVAIPQPKAATLAPGLARTSLPSEPFVLCVVAPGYAPQTSDPIDPAAAPARLAFVLEAEVGIGGTVTAGGAPVAGALVKLGRPPEPHRCHQVDGFAVRLRANAIHETTTDADGRFWLAPPGSGEYLLLARADGRATAEIPSISYQAGTGVPDLVLELDHGGSIEGRVRVAAGERPEGVIVAVNRGDTFARTQRVGADGGYRFEDLTPGGWQVRRVERMVGTGGHTTAVSLCAEDDFAVDCQVVRGETTFFDLDLRDQQPCVLAGELSWSGLSTAGWTVMLVPASGILDGDAQPASALDAQGRFELETPEPGAYRLQIATSAGALVSTVELERGRREWALKVRGARLTVRRPAGTEDELVLQVSAPDYGFYALFPPDGDAAIDVPAGEAALGRYVQATGTQLSTFEPQLELVLAPGETRTVEVP